MSNNTITSRSIITGPEHFAPCDTCLGTKNPFTRPKAALKPMDWAEYHPRQAIALDLATMAPNRRLQVCDAYESIDDMSKWMERCPLGNISAQSVTNNVKGEWIERDGPPKILWTEQGQQVDGLEIQDMCKEYDIQKRHSSPCHPQGD